MTGAGNPSLDIVVVGAQRAGSSHLSACLGDHPEIYVCPDEVPYFEDPFFANTPPSALAAVFARARSGQRLGIHRPEYLARPECAERIHEHSPAARIVVVLRDPVARAVSAYFWYVQFGLLPLEALDTGMERLLSGAVDPAYPRAQEVIDFGRYAGQVRRYFDVFGPDQVLVVLADELDDAVTYARVWRFLDVDPDHRPPLPDRHANAGVYDLRRLRVLRTRRRLAWSWDRTTTYEYRPRRRRQRLRFLPNAAVVGFDRVVLSRVFGNGSAQLRPDLAERLRAVYATDIALLSSLLTCDLSMWALPPAGR